MEEYLKQEPADCLKVVLFGPESTGKTTLSRQLARYCDSGVILAAIDHSQMTADADDAADDAFCQQFGLRDLGLDTERNLTQYNPIPEAKADMTLLLKSSIIWT